MPIRILIADDHGVLRAGLRARLNGEPGLQVVGVAADGIEALQLTQELKPDILLLDITMPGLNGIEVAERVTATVPGVRILILTVHEDEGLLEASIHAGASGYIIKRAVESELMNAIQAVSRGEIYVHPAMMRSLLKATAPHPPLPSSVPAKELTPRELEVVRLIVEGHTNREIAERLSLSVRTVESHRTNLMAKLHLTNRAELVRYAKEHGLLMGR